MKPQPRPYQQKLIVETHEAHAAGALNVMPVLATGGGKTVVSCEMIDRHDGASVYIAHRHELVGSASLTLARYGIRHDIIASADTKRAIAALHVADLGQCFFTPGARCRVASVDTLVKRKDLGHWPATVTLGVGDEGHHFVTGGYDPIDGHKLGNKWHRAFLMFTNPAVRWIAPTATPFRADRKGLGIHADGLIHSIVKGPSHKWLVGEGYLTDYRVFCPESDIKALIAEETINASGDWTPAQGRKASKRSKIKGDVVDSYRKYAYGTLALVFTTDVDTAVEMAGNYNAAGIPAACITGTTDPTVRRNIFRQFVQRLIWVIVTVDIVGEGTDIPACETIIEARPTKSLSVWRQHWGRGIRPFWHDGREPATKEQRLASIASSRKPHAIFIDHTGGFIDPSLGPPDRDIAWSLDRPAKRATTASDAIPLRVCLGCFQPYERILPACSWCGTPRPAPTARSSPEAVEGDLAELAPDVLNRLRGAVDAVDRTPEEERQRLVNTGLPDLMVRANVKRHAERTAAQGSLRQSMALWGGIHHARGEDDRTIMRRFFWTFGMDVMSAMALGRGDAEALRLRVDEVVNHTLQTGS